MLMQREFTAIDGALFVVFLLTVIFGFRISRKDKPAEGKDKYSAWNVWMRVASLVIPDAFIFALALTAYAFDAICSSLLPIYYGKAFDEVSTHVAKGSNNVEEGINKLTSIFLCIIVIAVLISVASYGTARAGSNLGDFVKQRAQVFVRRCSILNLKFPNIEREKNRICRGYTLKMCLTTR